MGGSQSQERVIGVEEKPGDGEAQIIVTEDFLRHINDKQQQSSGESKYSREEKPEKEDEDIKFTPSAEQLLIGDDYHSEGGHSSQEESSQWKRKFILEQQKNQNLKTLNSETFDETVNEIRDKFASKTAGDMMPVCEECRDRVDECYQRNNSKPLLCSSLVKEYTECVERHRKELLQAPSQQV